MMSAPVRTVATTTQQSTNIHLGHDVNVRIDRRTRNGRTAMIGDAKSYFWPTKERPGVDPLISDTAQNRIRTELLAVENLIEQRGPDQ